MIGPLSALLPSLLAFAPSILVGPVEPQSEEWDACTSVMVSRGASADGSTMITYSADAPFMPKLLHHQGGPKTAGELIDVVGWEDDEVRGQIPQVAHTWSVVGLMNEHQLAIGETTTGGRRELRDPKGLLDYDALIWLTLQRAKTAREAISTIEGLCADHGYGSSGETFAIADKDEVWVMELIGRGPDQKGILWVAARVPEGSISASANLSRIGAFPRNDPDHWRYAKDIESFAIERGYYDPDSGRPFRYHEAYHPDPKPSSLRACGTRVWSIFSRVCPNTAFSSDLHRGVEGAERYPLFVEVEQKLSVRDVMGLMRDHYEGTPFDMTQGVDAGPFSSPYRFRGLTWKIDDQTYSWERPISTQQAGFVMLSQCRGWLPDPVGGVYWFTPDDPYTSAFTPLYCGITDLPKSYTTGDYDRFSWDSAWWISNLVSNLTYDRWSRVIPEVLKAQTESEETFLAMMPAIDRAAADLFARDEALARRFLTDWSVGNADRLFADWQDLASAIITRHVDGYVKEDGRSRGVGYSEEWLKKVVEEKGDALALPREKASASAAGAH